MSLRVSFPSFAAAIGLLTVPMFAQTLAESAAAAAGGSAAGVAGKVVSDSISKTMGKVPNLLDAAASTGTTTARPVEKVAPAPPPPSQSASPMTFGGGGSGNGEMAAPRPAPRPSSHRAAVAKPKSSAVPDVVSDRAMPAPRIAIPALPPPPPLTVADLQKIQVGANRKEVFAALGTPAFKMEIPDEGHLTEVMHYASAGADLGSVHLSDGTVTEVKINN